MLLLSVAGVELSVSCSGHFTPNGTAPCTQWMSVLLYSKYCLHNVQDQLNMSLTVIKVLILRNGEVSRMTNRQGTERN